MSEDRTQAPSKRRRDEARAQGVVARSPELTAAVGLLAAGVLLGFWGDALATAMIDLICAPLVAPSPTDADPSAMLRRAALSVAFPMAGLLAGVAAAMVAAHQAQVGMFAAPNLLAPDLARLWNPSGAGWGDRAARGVWGIAKAAIVVAITAWAVRAEASRIAGLSAASPAELARGCAATTTALLRTLGLALLALGAIDYALARHRIETFLSTTPEQNREEQKAIDGDPAVRSRRQKLARSWRSDPGDVLAGACLVVSGPGGLAVVLGGAGPPGKVTVRGVARGASGAILRRSAKEAGVSVAESPALAKHFAGASARGRPLPEPLRRDLAALWPGASARGDRLPISEA